MRKKSHKEGGTEMLALITSRFESGSDFIAQAFIKDKEFPSICKDYFDCHRALETWRNSDAVVAAQRLQEYSELLEELGRDIREWLDKPDVAKQERD